MRFAFPLSRGALGAALAALAAGCVGPVPEEGGPPPPSEPVPHGAAIAFEQEGTLALFPGEEREITVRIDPPGAHEITFSILAGFELQQPIDATLHASKIVSGADGRGSVLLQASSFASTFEVRAALSPDRTATLPVAVGGEGFGAVEVIPVYGGVRGHATWVAAAMTGTSCAQLAHELPADHPGALTAPAPKGKHPLLAVVPAGVPLAVTVRSGYFLSGCADLPSITAQATTEVKVPVVDVPLDLSAAALDVKLAFAPDPIPWGVLLSSAVNAMKDAFLVSDDPPVAAAALLDAMREATPPSDVDAFDKARATASWDYLVAQHLGSHGVALRKVVDYWAHTGLDVQAPYLLGRLESDGVDGFARLKLLVFGSSAAPGIAVDGWTLVAFDPGPGDAVQLEATLAWLPTRYTGASALLGAKLTTPGVTLVPEALAGVAKCAALAETLWGHEGCGPSCLQARCGAALAAMWGRGVDASLLDASLETLEVTLSAGAAVGEHAEIVAFDGSWIGKVTDGASEAQVAGAALGLTPAPKPPE